MKKYGLGYLSGQPVWLVVMVMGGENPDLNLAKTKPAAMTININQNKYKTSTCLRMLKCYGTQACS
jgi:hypothetical protein